MDESPEQQGRATLPASLRLKHRFDFLRIQRDGGRAQTPHFVLLVTGGAGQRVGITVTKKVGNAVARNRIKRVVREVFRLHRRELPDGCDLVLIAKAGAQNLEFKDVLAELRTAKKALESALRYAIKKGSSPARPSHPKVTS